MPDKTNLGQSNQSLGVSHRSPPENPNLKANHAVGATANGYMSVAEAAAYLRLSKSYLDKARVSGAGPIFAKLASRIVYRRADLDAWVESSLRASTSGRPLQLTSQA